jgi:hypothetical protein
MNCCVALVLSQQRQFYARIGSFISESAAPTLVDNSYRRACGHAEHRPHHQSGGTVRVQSTRCGFPARGRCRAVAGPRSARHGKCDLGEVMRGRRRTPRLSARTDLFKQKLTLAYFRKLAASIAASNCGCSRAICAANSCGVVPLATIPSFVSCATIAGSRVAAITR